ncbi:glycosyltransferase family 2 protein [Clostridioides difficile]|uniref:glycosyltransferase family 2 protein n=3 Tax=Clostridioides difficile TaxID=1496 RepID=UPI0002F19E0F|nr:glycosyltransferase family 2 protein [Clostridioides difficile]AXU48568.1 glycosyltransferase [Clostridioides difficile]AXU73990.1 glycosyltransferase [Clostridioides difficile]EGT2197542.1 glycosyltransferase [Clostridioides difficile]EGT4222905.1 glycosyltransferase family 2 protein [Clostridioides difficile]EGT4598722.1 glycosyltransferase family 2 protein [Clostridioides difficile]
MLLSIVMMVKNEERYLEKTLKSLDGIRKLIDAELVILDTGSTDSTIEIANKFTSNVYFEKWNYDFSDMRNKSISYAKGEWVLILDADEVLIDSSNIIKFFKNGIYKKYNSGTVNLNNIFSNEESEESVRSTISLLRLFRKKELLYKGRVHEQPVHEEPIYYNIATFDHYGYLFDDEEKKTNKVKRNGELLYKELEESPNDPYVIYQISKNLMLEDKFLDAFDYAYKSYHIYKDNKKFIPYVYSNLVGVCIVIGKYKEAEKICKEYIEIDKNNIDIYKYLGDIQKYFGKIKDSIKSYERYIYLVDNYNISTQSNSLIADGNTISHRNDVINEVIAMYYILENYKEVILKHSKITSFIKKRNSRKLMLISLEKTNQLEKIMSYYETLPDSDVERESFFRDLEALIKSIKDNDRNNLYKILSKIKGPYGRLNQIRLEKKISLEECREILKKENNPIYAALINIAIENGIDIIDIIYDFDSIQIDSYIGYSLAYKKEFGLKLYKYVLDLENTMDIEKIRIYKILTQQVLGKVKLNENKYKELFYIYIMYSYQCIKYLHKDFEDEKLLKYTFNALDRFCIKFKNVTQHNIDNKHEHIKILKNLLMEYPEYKMIIKSLIKDLEKELNKSDELIELQKRFLKNIEKIINDGEIKEAKELVYDYSQIFDDNVDVLNAKGILFIIEGKYKEADFVFKKALSMNLDNEDTRHNINYLKNLY